MENLTEKRKIPKQLLKLTIHASSIADHVRTTGYAQDKVGSL